MLLDEFQPRRVKNLNIASFSWVPVHHNVNSFCQHISLPISVLQQAQKHSQVTMDLNTLETMSFLKTTHTKHIKIKVLECSSVIRVWHEENNKTPCKKSIAALLIISKS